jgi:hypothetical protein
MQDNKDSDTEQFCTKNNSEKTQNKSLKKRELELDSIRKKQKQENEIEKDLFDMVLEIGGLGN